MPYGYPYCCGYPVPYPVYPCRPGGIGPWYALFIVLLILILLFWGWGYIC